MCILIIVDKKAPEEPQVDTHLSLSFLYMCAMSGTKGSSGFGSQSNEHMDNKTGIKKNLQQQIS